MCTILCEEHPSLPHPLATNLGSIWNYLQRTTVATALLPSSFPSIHNSVHTRRRGKPGEKLRSAHPPYTHAIDCHIIHVLWAYISCALYLPGLTLSIFSHSLCKNVPNSTLLTFTAYSLVAWNSMHTRCTAHSTHSIAYPAVASAERWRPQQYTIPAASVHYDTAGPICLALNWSLISHIESREHLRIW